MRHDEDSTISTALWLVRGLLESATSDRNNHLRLICVKIVFVGVLTLLFARWMQHRLRGYGAGMTVRCFASQYIRVAQAHWTMARLRRDAGTNLCGNIRNDTGKMKIKFMCTIVADSNRVLQPPGYLVMQKVLPRPVA